MARNTPPLHAKGVYTLKTPWTTVGDALYEAIAIRSFEDFIERGEDAYTRFYASKGLTRELYEADKAAGAHIVTLQSPVSAVIHVPDTYIEKFPDLTNVAYKRVVCTVELGALPDGVDLTHLKASLASVSSDITGVEAVVAEFIAPSAGVVSADQHATQEAARQAAITNRTTDRATVLSQQETIDAQAEKIRQLQQLIQQLQG